MIKIRKRVRLISGVHQYLYSIMLESDVIGWVIESVGSDVLLLADL